MAQELKEERVLVPIQVGAEESRWPVPSPGEWQKILQKAPWPPGEILRWIALEEGEAQAQEQWLQMLRTYSSQLQEERAAWELTLDVAERLFPEEEEPVARAIARSAIPVIAAVGHEPDVTIADFAADLRASTPSNGAERAVPDQGELRDVLAHWEARLQRAMDRTLQKGRDRLERAKASPFLQSPLRTIQEKRMLLDYQQQRLVHGMERKLQTGREQTARLAASLEALSPFRVLSRGYSIAQKEDGTVLSSIQQVSVGEALSLRLADGQVTCTATGKEKHRWQKRN